MRKIGGMILLILLVTTLLGCYRDQRPERVVYVQSPSSQQQSCTQAQASSGQAECNQECTDCPPQQAQQACPQPQTQREVVIVREPEDREYRRDYCYPGSWCSTPSWYYWPSFNFYWRGGYGYRHRGYRGGYGGYGYSAPRPPGVQTK